MTKLRTRELVAIECEMLDCPELALEHRQTMPVILAGGPHAETNRAAMVDTTWCASSAGCGRRASYIDGAAINTFDAGSMLAGCGGSRIMPFADPEAKREQHNHHCLLGFAGQTWCITAVRWPLIDCLRRIDGATIVMQTIDMSASSPADIDAYCDAAVAWDYRMAAVREASEGWMTPNEVRALEERADD